MVKKKPVRKKLTKEKKAIKENKVIDKGKPVKEKKLVEKMVKIEPFMTKKEEKMKIQATYEREADGCIKATISIIDQGFFPTVNLFKSTSDNPSGDTWNLGEGTQNTISKTLPNPDEAKQWVSTQFNALKGKIDDWLAIPVPEPEEFEIKG